MIKELVVISGKGGTGKTSVTASFAVLADHPVIADCDVDAADLHLILSPKVTERHDFYSGHQAVIRQEECSNCGLCVDYCRFDAIKLRGNSPSDLEIYIDPVSCEGCGLCVAMCPFKVIDFPEQLCGEWMVSETRCGTMVHAKLGVAAENSGKLVSLVRQEAQRIAEEKQSSVVIVDGPPGIGCPVISAVTGASAVLVVTEPTLSGEHDMERVLSLAKYFNIPAMVSVNKWDINKDMTERIEQKATEAGANITGRICYDRAVTDAQMQELAVVEMDTEAAEDIRKIWDNIRGQI